jgi:hypothetical protein
MNAITAKFNAITATSTITIVDMLACGWSAAAGELAIANGCDAMVAFATEAERDAFMAAFPKMVGLRANHLYHSTGKLPCATFSVRMASNGTTGAANEAGAKRVARFAAIAATLFPAR